jgi:hypothetical protein
VSRLELDIAGLVRDVKSAGGYTKMTEIMIAKGIEDLCTEIRGL